MDFKVIGYYITKKHSFLYPQDKKSTGRHLAPVVWFYLLRFCFPARN